MTKRDDFELALDLMKFEPDFKRWAENEELDEMEINYIVVNGMDHKLHETVKCDIIRLKYNFRPHQRYKKKREAGLYDPGIFWTVRAMAEKDKKPEEIAKSDETDLERLESIISGDFRVTDRLKAMELKEKLTKIYQGDIAMKPWQRIWVEHIIPNMVHDKGLG